MLHHLLLILAGIAGGFINTFAAGGSVVQLPAMIALGLHPMIANTTNHVPVLLGFLAAIWRFHRSGTMPWRDGFKISMPMVLGSLGGALTASYISDRVTGYVLLASLLLALVLMVAKPDRWLHQISEQSELTIGPLVLFLSFLVGFWAGLIVIGSGVFILLTLVLAANFRIPQANAIKVLTIGIATLLSVIVFGLKGQIAWAWAIPVSIGSISGSLIGAKLVTIQSTGKWVYMLILITLMTEIVHLGSGVFH